jgi:RNA polymerase sigma factor (sigma-70 family)
MSSGIGRVLMRAQSDARLLEIARAGHEPAFEAIVQRYRRPLEQFCRRLLPPALVEDAMQATLLSAWTALRRGAEVRELRPWLYAIARNAALKALAKAGEHGSELSEHLAATESTPDIVELRSRTRETLAALAALPERQRDAFLKTVLEGRSREQIALELELSEGAVRQLVHRARVTLREAATALVPLPLLLRFAARAHTTAVPMSERVAELAPGAGAAGAAGALKLAVLLGATGAVAAAVAAPHVVPDRRAAPSVPAATAARAAAVAPAAATATPRADGSAAAESPRAPGGDGGRTPRAQPRRRPAHAHVASSGNGDSTTGDSASDEPAADDPTAETDAPASDDPTPGDPPARESPPAAGDPPTPDPAPDPPAEPAAPEPAAEPAP